MTIQELATMLGSLGIPIAYSHFTKDVSPPYLTYLFVNDNTFIADNINYVSNDIYRIELYTSKRELEQEQLIENKLKENEMPFRKFAGGWIEEEKVYQINYEVSI